MTRKSCYLAIMLVALLIGLSSPAGAGWLSDTLQDAVQGAGERGVREAVDAGYEGGKKAGKKAAENASQAPEGQAEDTGKKNGAPGEMKEGQWEISMTVNMPGMPVAIPPQTFRSCLNRENAVPRQEDEEADCDFEEMTNDGQTVKWRVTCRDENGAVAKSNGKIVYSGGSFQGEMATETTDPENGRMKMTSTMKGRYLGPCPD